MAPEAPETPESKAWAPGLPALPLGPPAPAPPPLSLCIAWNEQGVTQIGSQEFSTAARLATGPVAAPLATGPTIFPPRSLLLLLELLEGLLLRKDEALENFH